MRPSTAEASDTSQAAGSDWLPKDSTAWLKRVVMRDWAAIVFGQQAKENDRIKECLDAAVEDLASSLESQTLNAFAWMIADRLLDLRFAIPRQAYRGGDYHDKVAYFRDPLGNCVAIHGSYNDSVKGTLNGEAFSVFRSWNDGQKPFVEKHVSRLQALWNDQNPQFHSLPLPEAIRDKIVKLRSTPECPYRCSGHMEHVKTAPCIPRDVVLRDYQEEAIRSWQVSDCRGIFEMATGSGKTYTALAAATAELKARGRLATVILVPYMHLLDQWKDDCEAFGFRPVLCGSSHPKWRAELRSAISDFRLTGSHLCVIAVHHTASSETFRKAFGSLPGDELLVIADEVHGLGARRLRNALQDGFGLRLGLSATPRRWYDEEGTAILFDYFDDVCFSLSLEDAITRGFLVPYRYEPHLVQLTPEEEQVIYDLTVAIGRLMAKHSKSSLDESEQAFLEKALRERALVVKTAEDKFNVLRRLISQLREQGQALGYSLFYSPDGKHAHVLRLLKDEGIMAHQFIGEDSVTARKRILVEFDQGRIAALVAMKCLDEGVDVPSIRTAFLISSTTNPKEFIQRRGRVLRHSPGKNRAVIHDFIVVPSSGSLPDVAKYLLKREMPRFAECADAAENAFAARDILRPLLDTFQMLHLLDMKPWDVYHAHYSDTRDDLR